MDRILIGESCEVLVGRAALSDVLPHRPARTGVVVVCQPGSRQVAEAVAGDVGAAGLVELADREEAKSMRSLEGIYDALGSHRLDRDGTVVAVGGGTVTDVAGFAAATWLRGVEWVAIPTTLLGAVDAALGGKTGVNLGGKNLVGAFWHPARVVVDLDVLDRLPVELLREGSAEALKAGFVADPAIVEAYERDGRDAPLDLVVPRAIAVKAGIVSQDFREAGRRAVLNLGHTIGHGIEVVAPMPHGHAVAVGMVAAAEVSRLRHGFDAARLRAAVERLGLPAAAPGVDPEAVLDLVGRDKKRQAGALRMVLLRDIGDPVVEPVTEDELRAAIGAVVTG